MHEYSVQIEITSGSNYATKLTELWDQENQLGVTLGTALPSGAPTTTVTCAPRKQTKHVPSELKAKILEAQQPSR
jgi:hypothetical protein